jgi:predicted ribosomally synthesized peptide with SipW-like signal peptide
MSRKNLKRYLMLLAVVGLVAIASGGGTGTFASFSAEVANTGNYFATGTLFLHDNGGTTTCTSESDLTGNANITSPTGCDVLFHVNPLAPNSLSSAPLQLTNAGSVNATDLKFSLGSTGCTEAPPTIATLRTAITSGAGVSSLDLSNLSQTLVDHTKIILTDVGGSQTFTVTTTTAGGGSVTVPVSVPGGNATHNYSTAATVTIATTFGSPALCSALQFYIVETTSSYNTADTFALKCVYGTASGTTCTPSPGTTLSSPGISYSPLSLFSDGSGNTVTHTGIDAGKSRYFVLGVQAPSVANFVNTYQNDQVSFDLKWKIDE